VALYTGKARGEDRREMDRWLMVLVALVVAGCGHEAAPAPAADAPAGRPSLTINVHAMIGMVVSEPAGIRCGACQVTQSSGVPCPPGPRMDQTCGFDFPAGTMVSLSLVGQDAYTDFVCAAEPEKLVKSCDLTIGAPVTIGVWGEVPAR
jgi:hypothetical protein